MSTRISKIIIKSITKVVKNTSKFDIVVDDLIYQFRFGCPPKPELLRLVAQKNQIQSALSNLGDTINTLQSTADNINGIISAVSSTVKVIKAIPVPTSVPPGVGIPINVITILADSLDFLGKLLDGAKGSVSIVPTSTKVIADSIRRVLEKLGELDVAINSCIEELATGLTQQEKNNLINEIGNAAATSGDFSNLELNTEEEDALVSRLSPNSTDPLIYKRFKLEIQYNEDNEFTFPQRRIRGVRERTNETRPATLPEKNWFEPRVKFFNGFVTDTYPAQTFTNLLDGGYSYSTSVKVLINEIKFRIDQEARLTPFKTPNLNTPLAEVKLPSPLNPLPPSGNTNTGGNNSTGGSVGGAGGGSGGGGGGGANGGGAISGGDFDNDFNPLGNTNNNLNQL